MQIKELTAPASCELAEGLYSQLFFHTLKSRFCGFGYWVHYCGCFSRFNFSLLNSGYGNYGRRVVIRSIKAIQRGEEATITYIDLLQPTVNSICSCASSFLSVAMFWLDCNLFSLLGRG